MKRKDFLFVVFWIASLLFIDILFLFVVLIFYVNFLITIYSKCTKCACNGILRKDFLDNDKLV